MVQVELLSESTVTELALLALSFVLSASIGIERQRRLKSAGLRTHTLVGIGSTVFTLVSAYGFGSVSSADVVLDPSRIAAQVVSGIGFLGAGVIFVRRNTVNGLTTAASIWVTAAIGMACGAGMPILGLAATMLYIATASLLTSIGRRISAPAMIPTVTITYKEGHGALRGILATSNEHGFDTSLTNAQRSRTAKKGTQRIEAELAFKGGSRALGELMADLSEIEGVITVGAKDQSH